VLPFVWLSSLGFASGVDLPLTVDPGADGSTVDLCAHFSLHINPPPQVKDRMVGGVWNLLSIVDLHVARSAIDLSALFILHIRPPPPQLLKVEQSRGSGIHYPPLIYAPLDQSLILACSLFSGREPKMCGANLGYCSFCGFFAASLFLKSPWG
jgi:hypothetical protein